MGEEFKIALFLGAGASVPYDKPVTKEIRKRLLKKYGDIFNSTGSLGTPEGLLYAFLSNQEFEDIEDVLQSLREWQSFNRLGHAIKFLNGHNSIIQINSSRQVHYQIRDLLKNVDKATKLLEDDIFAEYQWDRKTNDVLRRIYTSFFDFILQYSPVVKVMTTNYDKAIETFCIEERKTFRCVDGFSHDSEIGLYLWNNGRYDGPSEVGKKDVFLYKVHGSLDWKKHVSFGIVKTNEEGRSPDPSYIENLLVFPTVSPKEDAEEEPFASILKNMEVVANETDCIIVIGFSFRDHNINTIFKKFVESGRLLIVISPQASERLNETKDTIGDPAKRAIHTINLGIDEKTVGQIISEAHTVIGLYRKTEREPEA